MNFFFNEKEHYLTFNLDWASENRETQKRPVFNFTPKEDAPGCVRHSQHISL